MPDPTNIMLIAIIILLVFGLDVLMGLLRLLLKKSIAFFLGFLIAFLALNLLTPAQQEINLTLAVLGGLLLANLPGKAA